MELTAGISSTGEKGDEEGEPPRETGFSTTGDTGISTLGLTCSSEAELSITGTVGEQEGLSTFGEADGLPPTESGLSMRREDGASTREFVLLCLREGGIVATMEEEDGLPPTETGFSTSGETGETGLSTETRLSAV